MSDQTALIDFQWRYEPVQHKPWALLVGKPPIDVHLLEPRDQILGRPDWVVLWQLGSFLGSFLLGSDGLLLDGARSLLVSANRLLTDALAIGACSFVYEAVRSRPASEG